LIEKEYGIKEILNKCKNNNFLELDNDVFLNQDIEFEWPSMKNKIISCKGKCYGLKNQIAILVNGDVVPCCLDTDGDIILGNIFKNNLDQILESNRAKRIIEGFNNSQLVEELCKRCNFIKKFN
jgi:radical SAM protein with 4Fe4S-binding SPASM domain